MSKTAGVVLILGGLAVAVHVITSDDAVNGSDAAGEVELAKNAERAADAAPSGAQPAIWPVSPVTRTEPLSSPSAPVVVRLTPRPNDPAPPRLATIPKDRDSLARELQKELRRVGCYEGELNGVWTPATRRAMKTFTDRVNATLPVDEPDAVLFAMVQGQQDRVCGKPCPADQGLSEDGRCLPNAILAKAAKKPAPSAVAGYVPAAAKPGPAITGWSTTVTTAPRPSPPAFGAAPVPPPALASTAAPAASAPPTSEGRMALAGPPAPETPGSPEAAGQAAAPRPALPTPPKRVVQDRGSWVRVMNARRFDSPN